MSNPWYMYPIVVPFGNSHFDVGLGGSHDMDIAPPPNYPVTALLPGRVCDISSPLWGQQIGIQLDQPYNSIPYMGYVHLSATHPVLTNGKHVNAGDIIGWVGGATQESQYAGTANPTGSNFLNDPNMSSRVQVGIALMRGPVYGSGAGWEAFPPIDMSLDPTPIIEAARQTFLSTSGLPPGWSDDGTKLTAPNGVSFVLGFRAHVLPLLQSGAWQADDYPTKPQYYATRLEGSNPDLGDGDQIITRRHVLGYPHNPVGSAAHLKDTVIEEFAGAELDWTRTQYAALFDAYQKLKAGQPPAQVLTDMQTIKAVASKY